MYLAGDGPSLELPVDRRGRAFIRGTGFTPSSAGGVLTCDRNLRVVSGAMARLSRIAEHEFLVAFPGVVLLASAQVVRPRKRDPEFGHTDR